MVSQVGVNGAATARSGQAGDDIAGSLLTSHRQNGRLDTDGLAEAVKAQAAQHPEQAKTLTAALELRMTPVERGAFESALSGSEEGIGAFFDGAIRGDFSDNNSWSKLGGQTAMGFVPIAGQIADARDTAAAVGQVWRGEDGGWLNLGAAAIGWIPGIGDAAKGLIRGGGHAAEGVERAAVKGLKAADDAGEAGHAATRTETRVAKESEETTARASAKVRKFDDADAFNAAANDAAPNTRYEYGRYSYTTDDKGRVSTAEGQVGLDATGRNDPKLQAEIGHEGKSTDIGFHIIGDRFGAQTNRLNVVPGNGKPIGDGLPNLNQGAYKKFENTVATLAENPKNKVEVRIEARYGADNATTRPDGFQASYRVNGGAWRTQTFVNK
ncbi:hypothetical protein HL653_20945 [Sphingomonas sp. AP4-R1]|uniref:DNA/RNA non-specific endonuclease n=1 Tax=Sphingomonas sp. AP4-R1 TaxID=2735134 RepID=UPI0014937226|nr:DNA/RNA non-specific endonuclease [Sphingomonas sp. AP4-R1]QJU59880.1 hypothetical protein HL653_20945 [Sphingomonas sp. AP4-R1]